MAELVLELVTAAAGWSLLGTWTSYLDRLTLNWLAKLLKHRCQERFSFKAVANVLLTQALPNELVEALFATV